VITTVPGQAYYMVKGQTHPFTNKSAAAVQVIELFIKPDPGTTAAPAADPTPAPAATPVAPAPAAPAPATPAPTTPPAK
ncbi:MAG TPA: hypothetical protein VFO48_02125, partial [Vicinamibacterales bacterium]|nr:hypothetical protein [Vicinamibacterales bacterium]